MHGIFGIIRWGGTVPSPPSLTFLLDTNEIIPAEPFGSAAEEPVARLISLCIEHGHRVVVHPANVADLSRVKDTAERAQKLAALRKYPMLAESPVSSDLESRAGASIPGSNDDRDLRLLAAVDSGAATYLVTEDRRLRKRAARAGIGSSLASVDEALDLLGRLHPADAVPPPIVDLIETYKVDFRQVLFDSLRDDYPEFDEWFRTKVAKDARGRRCWAVVDRDGKYDAIAIVKIADEHPDNPRRTATKISTFKVAPHRAGEKVGELFLRAILEWAHGQPAVDTLFVEVKPEPDKEPLRRFLEQFGFEKSAVEAKVNGDITYVKSLVAPATTRLSPFDFHVRYGPPALLGSARLFVIPVKPHWYLGLFPDSPTFGAFGALTLSGVAAPPTPFGNAIRKAYLCHSPTKTIPPGSTLLFYRSAEANGKGKAKGGGAIQAVGVAERSIRTANSERILSFVGRRTVYSAEDVGAMCEGSKAVLATLFRHDHYLDTPWTLHELITISVLNGAPQSVTEVKSERGRQWLRNELGA
jgi:GNAT superfamily N-acetyltransferase